jgi:hypothetical protein
MNDLFAARPGIGGFKSARCDVKKSCSGSSMFSKLFANGAVRHSATRLWNGRARYNFVSSLPNNMPRGVELTTSS